MPIYFKRQRDSSYREFSNFYPCEFQICARDIFTDPIEFEFASEFVDKRITVHSSEQAMMWMKAILMKDTTTAKKIERARAPYECHRLGQKVSPLDANRWDLWKEEIAVYVLTEKFSSSDHLYSTLLTTKGQSIAEANTKDPVWGIGIGKHQAMKGVEWKGQNLLGKSLMTVREHLERWDFLVSRVSNDFVVTSE